MPPQRNKRFEQDYQVSDDQEKAQLPEFPRKVDTPNG